MFNDGLLYGAHDDYYSITRAVTEARLDLSKRLHLWTVSNTVK